MSLSSSDEDVVIACASFIIMKSIEKKNKNKKKRRWWRRSLFKREKYSGTDLLHDLTSEDGSLFNNFNRMTANDFEKLICMIGPVIAKKDTNYRKSIPVKERLSITLRFLATGDSYTSLMYTFKVSKQTISTIVPEVCEALIEALQNLVEVPNSPEKWLKIADEYERLWNFPHCIGAIDGKHASLQAPVNSGSEFFNYKGYFSIVLMAAVDAKYSFIYVHVGCQGRISDGGVFKNTDLYTRMETETLNLPPSSPLPEQEKNTPYVFVADDAFALTDSIMKPYPGVHLKGSPKRAYNYRLCRARRVVENTFGILSTVFRVLREPLLLEPKKAISVVLACVYLHNFLRESKTSKQIYTPEGTFDVEDIENGKIVPGSWRRTICTGTSFLPLEKRGRKASTTAQEVREQFTEYFSTVGRVPWQNNFE